MTPTPSDLFGDLFACVQESGIFADSKTFADAVPRLAPEAILAAWRDDPPAGNDAIRAFVIANFDLPDEGERAATPASQPLADRIAELWPSLTREPVVSVPGSSALALPYRHVVPGGRFRELYYWDSYFTMLGLAQSGRQDLVEEMILNFGSLIDRYGHIPNGTRSYYLSRSHPPLFHLMAGLSRDTSEPARRQRLAWMLAEHAYWMAGADDLPPGGEHRRVVRLGDGALLNRYWDDRAAPRDESWREDVELARAVPDRLAGEVWRDLRAAAESGWDFSSRWLGDGRTLATIRTTRMIPIDLNAILYGLELSIAEAARGLGDDHVADGFDARAEARRAAVDRYLWNATGGFYADYDIDRAEVRDQFTGALGFALFAGIATEERAAAAAAAVRQLMRAGGLLATTQETGEQWDAPNGWAPLQWVAIQGLRAYGHDDLADDIAIRWVSMVEDYHAVTGQLLEKYDVVDRQAGGGGEYGVELGFGWTNGVTLALMPRG